MKKYICLNHGECQFADEIPPREFELKDGDVNCTNCGSANIREAVSPPVFPWKKIGIGVAAALILVSGIIWALATPPLGISVEADCTNNTVTVSTVGGSKEPISFNSPDLGKRQADSIFRIPADKRSGATLTFWAVQGSDSVKTSLVISCEKHIPLGGGHTEKGPQNPPPPEHQAKDNPGSVVWNRVKGSEFCVEDCVVEYTELDNLGHTRTRRTNNYADCCPANK